MKFIIKNILPILFIFYSFSLNSQTVTCETVGNKIHLDNSCTQEPNTYTGREQISLKPGYRFSSSEGAMKAKIDKSISFDLDYTPEENVPDVNIININTNLAVGAIPGYPAVSGSGAGTYTIPVEIPQGVAGLTPDLSISYNSQSGMGMLGLGWHLNGISAITRVPQTKYYDNNITGIQLNSNDRFAIDGNRLLPKSGVNGGYSYIYEKEITDFSTITPYIDNYEKGPQYFIVNTKDGYVIEYGKENNSCLYSAGSDAIIAWYINKITDRNGNSVYFNYYNNNNECVISSIRYSTITIDFLYDKKTVDRQISYIHNGSYVNSERILKKIIVKNKNIVLRSYEFNYFNDGCFTKLYEIKLFGNNDKEVNSTIINYGDKGTEFLSNPVNNTLPIIFNQDQFLGDFTGNGKTDILLGNHIIDSDGKKKYNSLHLYWNMSNDPNINFQSATYDLPENSYIPEEAYSKVKFNNTYYVSDFRGVKKDQVLIIDKTPVGDERELLEINAYKILTFNPNSSSFDSFAFDPPQAEEGIFATQTNKRNYIFGDFDGNGTTDILALLTNYVNGRINIVPYLYYFDDNLGFTQIPFDLDIFDSQQVIPMLNYDPASENIVGVYVFDYNNDGKQDILITTGTGSSVIEINIRDNKAVINHLYYKLDFLKTTEKTVRAIGDFNGDGKTDLIYSVNSIPDLLYILYSGGNGFLKENGELYGFSLLNIQMEGDNDFENQIYTGDFNGDGRTDILVSRNKWSNFFLLFYLEIYYSSSYKITPLFEYTKKVHIPEYRTLINNITISRNKIINIMAGDFLGNGYSSAININSYTPSSSSFYHFNINDESRYVTQIRDGMGNKAGFSYKMMTNTPAYNNSIPVWFPRKIQEMPIPIPVVTETRFDNAYDPESYTTTYYNYYGSSYNNFKKAWLGFHKVKSTTMTSINSGNDAVQYLNITENMPVEGELFLPDRQKSGLSEATPVNETEYTYKTLYPNSQNSKIIYPYAEITKSIKYSQNRIGNETIITNNIDNFGNLINSKTEIKETGAVDSKMEIIKEYRYTNAGLSRPNKVSFESTTSTYAGSAPSTGSKSFEYDANGNLSKQSDLNTGIYTTYNYYTKGRPQEIITSYPDKPNTTLNLRYSSDGRFLVKRTGNDGIAEKFKYDESTGNLSEHTDKFGHKTIYKYDSFNRLIEETDILGITSKVQYEWLINTGDPNIIYSITNTKPGTPYTKEYYDKSGRIIKTETVGYNSAKIISKAEYDRSGNIIKETIPHFESELPKYTEYEYYTSGYYFNSLKKQSSQGLDINYTYGHNVSTTTYPLERQFTNYYDCTGNIIKSVSPLRSTVEFTYNSSGNPSRVVANNVETFMEYDPVTLHQTKLNDVNSGEVAYEYFKDGTLKKQTDSRLVSTEMFYDNLGRIESIQNPGENKSYEYYEDGDSRNLLKSANSGNYGIIFEYDDLQRIKKQTETIDNEDYSYSYQYYSNGNLHVKTYPGGFFITYEYDSNGYLIRVKINGSELVWQTSDYNSALQPLSVTLKNDLKYEYDYNEFSLLERIEFKKTSSSIYKLGYRFNEKTGNLEQRINYTNNLSEEFVYDKLDRLIRYNITNNNNTPDTYEVRYDQKGNITSKTGVGNYKYDESGKEHALIGLVSSGQIDESFPVPVSGQDIEYNSAGKVTRITEAGYQLNIYYGHDDERRKAELFFNGEKIYTRYYTGSYEKEIAGNATREYYYIPGPDGNIIAVYIKENGQGALYYTFTDYQNTVLALIDLNGNITGQQNFDPWGCPRNAITGSYENAQSISKIFRGYTFHEMLPEFGLINMNGRLYDPVLSRMLSPDNYVQDPNNAQNYNRYSYCLNNPLKYTDPSGEFWHLVIGAAIGGTVNLLANLKNIDNFWQGLSYFGVGAAAGALGAGVGAGISSAIAGTGFGAGFIGASTATTAASSFLTGAAVGGGAGFSSGFITGFGNDLLGGQNFSQALWNGTKYGIIGGLSGAAIGGVWSGSKAVRDGRRFWDGATVQKTILAEQNIPIIGQNGANNCLPASAEAVDKSFGGNMTQQDIRNLVAPGSDPMTAHLYDSDVWNAYSGASGHSWNFEPYPTSPATKLSNVLSNMQNGNRVAINLRLSGDVGHSVVMQRVIQQTITKVNGTVTQKLFYYVMNPANGGSIIRIGENSIANSYNIFYIFP